jgi:glycosyltransferase involved in cell wall biosynthesis
MNDKPFKVSVVMASYLGNYSNAATDRVRKFNRAVNSFLNQNYTEKELIVVSDGCSITINEISKYLSNPNIKIYGLDKQTNFSGTVRDLGVEKASGDIICYLDTDDFLGTNHLSQIVNSFNHYKDKDWIYFDDNIVYRLNPINNEIYTSAMRECKLEHGSIGTSSIAHKNLPNYNWQGCNGYGHDWLFVSKLMALSSNYTKVYHCQYNVCHIPNSSVDC